MKKSERDAKLSSMTKLKAKALTAYYGHPLKDMKLICIAGTTGKVVVAHLVHKILESAGQRVAVLASEQEIKMGSLHKFLGDAWKAGANYVIVTAASGSLAKGVFYGLPVHIAVMTDYAPNGDFLGPSFSGDKPAESILFDAGPDIVILNHDDVNYPMFRNYAGTKATLSYGKSHFADVLIESSKLYKKGTEIRLNIAGTHFAVASFLVGDSAVEQMAAAAAVASSLKIDTDAIVEGVADYDPDN